MSKRETLLVIILIVLVPITLVGIYLSHGQRYSDFIKRYDQYCIEHTNYQNLKCPLVLFVPCERKAYCPDEGEGLITCIEFEAWPMCHSRFFNTYD